MKFARDRLFDYFSSCADTDFSAKSVGMEVETHFVDRMECPISIDKSQLLLGGMIRRFDWRVSQTKGNLVTEICDEDGNKILYELGRQNIEVATAAQSPKRVVSAARRILDKLYLVGENVDAYPCLWPILETDENLLIIPDQRDATWLKLDGRSALELLARSAAVQFTITVSPQEAILCLRKLGRSIGIFLEDYPQEILWRRYIKESKASYCPLRYGGSLFFDSLQDYCKRLTEHDVVSGPKLIPHAECEKIDIPLFLRSVWWYFRLKRYGNQLCIEVRPMARRTDGKLKQQLEMVLGIMF